MVCQNDCNSCGVCLIDSEKENEILKKYISLTPNARNNFEYQYDIFSRPYRVILGLTAKCNLSCPYCFTHQHNNNMSFDTAKKACDMALDNYKFKKDNNLLLSENDKPSITFFGGEPLLRFNEIIVPIIKEYGCLFDYSITTNGVLLDEDTIDFLYKNNVEILLSFDGLKEIQNSQRPGKGFSSYDVVMKNIPYLLIRYPEVSVRSTLTKEMIPKLFDTYLMFEEIGFKNFICGVNSFEKWSNDDLNGCIKQLKLIAERIYTKLINKDLDKFCDFYGFKKFYNDIFNCISDNCRFDNEIMRCGMGTTTFSVTPEGDIVPCQEEITYPRNKIGDIISGINSEIHKAFLQNYFNNIEKSRCQKLCLPECYQTCQALRCPSREILNNFEYNITECYYHKALYQAFVPLFRLTAGSMDQDIQNYIGKRSF